MTSSNNAEKHEGDILTLVEKMSTQLHSALHELREGKIRDSLRDEEMSRLKETQATLEAKIDANTAMTKEVVDLFGALKGGFTVLGWLGSFAKWVAAVGAAALAIYSWYKGFKSS